MQMLFNVKTIPKHLYIAKICELHCMSVACLLTLTLSCWLILSSALLDLVICLVLPWLLIQSAIASPLP